MARQEQPIGPNRCRACGSLCERWPALIRTTSSLGPTSRGSGRRRATPLRPTRRKFAILRAGAVGPKGEIAHPLLDEEPPLAKVSLCHGELAIFGRFPATPRMPAMYGGSVAPDEFLFKGAISHKVAAGWVPVPANRIPKSVEGRVRVIEDVEILNVGAKADTESPSRNPHKRKKKPIPP